MLPLTLAACGGLLGAGCIVEAPGGASPAERRAATVARVPPVSVKSGANFEGKVEVVGASLEPGRAVPGEPVRVTMFFKVLAPLSEDYFVFVHVEDASGRGERMNVDHKPAGGLYPTSQWRVGETVKDEFTFTLPTGGATPSAVNLLFGFWQPETDTRLRLSNPQAVRSDGKDRVLLAQVPVANAR
ncbi:hypothetical protein FGE12_17970 [Aggregicoccus sp. 17bor-14]|nr:hypothetical protein [Simulacricoccus sp. 17bor-14]MRI90040.1 hypothetical protein [Aggregicoccus sp. 17bor-14]